MQSSPPTRGFVRPPSPAESQYSLDLAALDHESQSGASSPIAQQHVDKVLSEDIDGPSDFTLNMEKWMRGGSLSIGAAKGMQSTLHRVEEQDTESDERVPARSEQAEQPQQGAETADDEVTGSNHTPSNTPPRESSYRVEGQHSHGGEFGKPWNSPRVSASLEVPTSQQFRHPTIEDYHSELSPSRKSPVPASQSVTTKPCRNTIQERVASRSPISIASRPSSPILSLARSTATERATLRRFSSQTDEAVSERQLKQLRNLEARCHELERLNAALYKSLSDELSGRREENASHEAQLAEAARREKELTDMNNQALFSKEAPRLELRGMEQRTRQPDVVPGNLRDEIEKLKEDHAGALWKLEAQMKREHTQAIDELKREHSAEIQGLKDELELERSENEVRAIEKDLEIMRRSQSGPLGNLTINRTSMPGHHDQREAELERLQPESQQMQSFEVQMKGLNEQLQAVNLDNNNLIAKAKAAESTITNLRAELSVLKQTQDEEQARVMADHRRAVDLAEDLKGKLQELRRQLYDEQAAHDAEIEQLQAEHQTIPTSSLEEVEDLQCELEACQSERDVFLKERDALIDQSKALVRKLSDTTLELSDLKVVNSTLDNRISDALRRREGYWRGRLEKLESERKLMAKALLRQWGREDVGIEEPMQGYTYKYLERHERSRGQARASA